MADIEKAIAECCKQLKLSSTLAEQAAQVIPVTVNFSFILSPSVTIIVDFPEKINPNITIDIIFFLCYILSCDTRNTSTHYFVPYYLFGNHGGHYG